MLGADGGGAVAGHQLEQRQNEEELPGNEPASRSGGTVFRGDVAAVRPVGERCGKRGKRDEHAVEVLFAEALEQEREQHAADDGERIVQRHPGGSQAAVDFAPQENEQGRSGSAGEGGGGDEGCCGCGPDNGCGIRSGGEAEQKRDGRIHPPLARQGSEP